MIWPLLASSDVRDDRKPIVMKDPLETAVKRNRGTKRSISEEPIPWGDMCTSDLRNWPIFSLLKPEFVSQIHMVVVYGNPPFSLPLHTRFGSVVYFASRNR